MFTNLIPLEKSRCKRLKSRLTAQRSLTGFTNVIRGIRGFIRAHTRVHSRPFASIRVHSLGFTVVELLVAMSIFAIFLGIAFGVFVQAVKGQRELTRFMAVQNNAGLVLEQMMREMRTGYWFCEEARPDPNDPGKLIFPCESDADSITFVNHEGRDVSYTLNAGAVKSSGVSLTSGEVRVDRLRFIVTQQGDPCVPPRITILMRVGLVGAGDVAPVNLETTVSSRVFPVDVVGAPESVRLSCPSV